MVSVFSVPSQRSAHVCLSVVSASNNLLGPNQTGGVVCIDCWRLEGEARTADHNLVMRMLIVVGGRTLA